MYNPSHSSPISALEGKADLIFCGHFNILSARSTAQRRKSPVSDS